MKCEICGKKELVTKTEKKKKSCSSCRKDLHSKQ